MLPSKLIAPLVLLASVHSSAFQIARQSSATHSSLWAEPHDVERSQPRRPKIQRGVLSRMTTTELGVLTTIDREKGLKNKARTKKHNKQRLLRLLAPGMAALLRSNVASASQAMAALPPVGIGKICVPEPNVALLFALLSAISIGTLLQLSNDGYSALLRFMRNTGSFVWRDDAEEKKEAGMDLKGSTWDAYSGILGSLQDKKRRVRNKLTYLFAAVNAKAGDDEATKKAQQSAHFKEQQYKQQNHPLRTSISRPSDDEHAKQLTSNYPTPIKQSTWGIYKKQLSAIAPIASEVDELKEEVANLQSLVQIEQSMYQASNEALRLAMDAKDQEMEQSKMQNDLATFDSKLSTSEELKQFDKKAQEYEDTVLKESNEAKERLF